MAVDRCYPVGLSICPFCSLSTEQLWIETEHVLAVPDAFPVTDGHTLVIPRKHVATFYELPPVEQKAVWDLVAEVRRQLLVRFEPDGFNIGLNDGIAAGQSVMHAHVHVIPRRSGDVPDPRGGIRWVVPNKASYWRR